MFDYTSAHQTVLMNGAHLKITTFSTIKFQKHILWLFLTKNNFMLHKLTNEIIKGFYA